MTSNVDKIDWPSDLPYLHNILKYGADSACLTFLLQHDPNCAFDYDANGYIISEALLMYETAIPNELIPDIFESIAAARLMGSENVDYNQMLADLIEMECANVHIIKIVYSKYKEKLDASKIVMGLVKVAHATEDQDEKNELIAFAGTCASELLS